jgi:hypothetical protein
VSKLRENAKKVIGVGVKKSTSDLLVANCDEFIFYDDLVREQQRALAKREQQRTGNGGAKRADEPSRKPELEARRSEAIALAVETFDALASERDDVGKIWASVLKSAIKRRKPDFNESYYGFRAFGNLLDEAQARGLLEVGRDDKSGAFVSRPRHPVAAEPAATREAGGHHGHGGRDAAQPRASRAVAGTALMRGCRRARTRMRTMQPPSSSSTKRRSSRRRRLMRPKARRPAKRWRRWIRMATRRTVASAHARAPKKAGAKKGGDAKGGDAKGAARHGEAKPDDATHDGDRHGRDQHANPEHADTRHADRQHARAAHDDDRRGAGIGRARCAGERRDAA